MIEHHYTLFGHTFVIKCLWQACRIMPIIIDGHKRADELFAKLTIHETAFFLYCRGREAHEYEILQHIRSGVRIEDNRILTDWAINGIAATLSFLYCLVCHRFKVNCGGIGNKTLGITGSLGIRHYNSVT